ncbi:SIMPL domain-containing protein, partial [Quisquiliibacterium transsilvanicum]|uniref:SIMPL domain-containing protein n=1 Tax=Quisquiliibacterium transsilvanicum TaxID=1549638 RepID=UPI0031EB8B65
RRRRAARSVAWRPVLAALAASAALPMAPAGAAEPPPAGPLLRVDAQAQREVTDDIAVAVFFVERDGPEPSALQAAVNPVLQASLAELKRDPALQVRSGRYVTQPRYGREGRIEGWRVRGELIAESSDVSAVSKATSKLAGKMNVGSIGFRLSDEQRARAERELTGEAAAQFQEKARAAARALGYGDIELVEANLSSSGNPGVPMMRAAMSKDAMGAEAAPVPLEPGRSQVSVGFNGSFKLLRR